MKCLLTNEVCSNSNKKCKECKLDSCNNVLKVIEMQEKNTRKEELNRIIKQLPEECKKCSMLEIVECNKVKCFYRINGKCVLNEKAKV